MTRTSGALTVFAGVALLCLLTMLGILAHHRWAVREHQAEALHAGWRERNLKDLLALSALGGLSVQEQTRLQQAADDPERMRQLMLDWHEQQLANASKDLDDAQQRKVELGVAGGYKVFANQPQAQDLVALANQDEAAASSALAQLADGLRRIRAWQPVSFQAFAAGQQPPPSAAGSEAREKPVMRGRLKPDPRVPLGSIDNDASALPRPEPSQRMPLPSARELADAALHPTVTVYPEQRSQAPTQETADLGGRRRSEAEIRETLQRWAGAMTLNDAHAESAEYAPHMDRYFLRTNVNKSYVEADKAAYLRRGNRTANFTVQDVQIENETDTTADVRLVKDVTWAQSTNGATHKLIRSQLWLARTADGWKITGERDFR